MTSLERGMRIVGGTTEILGAKPNFSTAGKTGTIVAKARETVEGVTPNRQIVKVSVPSTKPVQTADDLMRRMTMLLSSELKRASQLRAIEPVCNYLSQSSQD